MNNMEEDQVSSAGSSTESEEEYVEVEVGGKQKIKKHHMVKSLVTAFEKQSEVLSERKIDRISKEEWLHIRDTKMQASGKWLTRDKDSVPVALLQVSPRNRSTTTIVVDRITAGAVASRERKDTAARVSRANSRERRDTTGTCRAPPSPRAFLTRLGSHELLPMQRASMSSGEVRTRRLNFQFHHPLSSPPSRTRVLDEQEEGHDTTPNGHVAPLEVTDAVRSAEADASPIASEADVTPTTTAEEGERTLPQEADVQPKPETLPIVEESHEHERKKEAAGRPKSKSASGERAVRKRMNSGSLKKSKSGSARRTKTNTKQKSQESIAIFITEPPLPTTEDEAMSPHTHAGSTPGPLRYSESKSQVSPRSHSPAGMRDRSMSGEDARLINFSPRSTEGGRKNSLPLTPINLPIVKDAPITSDSAGEMSPTVGGVSSSSTNRDRGRTASALASLFSKVSNWTDKSDKPGNRESLFTRLRTRNKPGESRTISHISRNHSGSDLNATQSSTEVPTTGKTGRSWGKYEGMRMIRKISVESRRDLSPEKTQSAKLPRSISFDSRSYFLGPEENKKPTGGEGSPESTPDATASDSNHFINSIVSQECETARRISESLTNRSSYQDLVNRGIVKEWNEERDSRRASIPSAVAAELQKEALRLQVKEGTDDDDAYDDLIISDDQNGWHVERGSDSDFVMGAFPALEDDQHYTLLYKKYFYEIDHTNFCASDSEFGPVIVSIEDKIGLKDAEGKQSRGQQILSFFNVNQTIQFFENMNDQPSTPRGTSRKERERQAAAQASVTAPGGFSAVPTNTTEESTRGSSHGPSAAVAQFHRSATESSLPLQHPSPPRASTSPKDAAPIDPNPPRPVSEKPRLRISSSIRVPKLAGGGLLNHSRSLSGPAKQGTITHDKGTGKDGEATSDDHQAGGHEKPERSQSSIFKFGLSHSDNRMDTYRALGARMIFIRSGPRAKDKLRALKVACAVTGYLPEIQAMRFKTINVDIREDLLKLERSFNSQNYKFGVLYCKKGQGENEMFTNSMNDSNKGWERFLDFLGQRITLKGWKNYTGGLDVKNETTGEESTYTEFREQRIMFHVSTLLPYFPFDEQQVERKRHLGNDIVVIVYLEPGAQFSPHIMTTQFNHIYCVVRMDNVDDEKPAVRVEYAAKAGVRPFGPKLPTNKPFLLDDAFREFFLTKLINGERAALCAPVFAVKLEKTRRALMNELVSKLIK